MKSNLNLNKLLTIDNTGLPCAPDLHQLLDKDVRSVFIRDTTNDKSMYIKEMGVVYYLGDPKSPAKQLGLTDKEALAMAIENFDLPKDYVPDAIVSNIIEKYYKSCITEAGVALEALRKSIHNVTLAANKINDILNAALRDAISKDEISSILNIMDSVSKRISEIPALTKSLSVAYENLQNEEEQQLARGGKIILSSMDADEE